MHCSVFLPFICFRLSTQLLTTDALLWPKKQGDPDEAFAPPLTSHSCVFIELASGQGQRTRPKFLSTIHNLQQVRASPLSITVSFEPGMCGRGQKIDGAKLQLREFSVNKVLQSVEVPLTGSECVTTVRFTGLEHDTQYEVTGCSLAKGGEEGRWCNILQVPFCVLVQMCISKKSSIRFDPRLTRMLTRERELWRLRPAAPPPSQPLEKRHRSGADTPLKLAANPMSASSPVAGTPPWICLVRLNAPNDAAALDLSRFQARSFPVRPDPSMIMNQKQRSYCHKDR